MSDVFYGKPIYVSITIGLDPCDGTDQITDEDAFAMVKGRLMRGPNDLTDHNGGKWNVLSVYDNAEPYTETPESKFSVDLSGSTGIVVGNGSTQVNHF